MKVASLVKHPDIPSLGVGLVTKNLGTHCMVQWTYEADHWYDDRVDPGPTLEVCSMLEVINVSNGIKLEKV